VRASYATGLLVCVREEVGKALYHLRSALLPPPFLFLFE
jgi:hypothetical protein